MMDVWCWSCWYENLSYDGNLGEMVCFEVTTRWSCKTLFNVTVLQRKTCEEQRRVLLMPGHNKLWHSSDGGQIQVVSDLF